MASSLVIAGREFKSRLMLGTGKFSSNELMSEALVASGTEIVTVALRRADLSGQSDPFANILDFIDPEKYLLLPNTSGAMNAEEAIRLARLAAAAGLPKWIKLEIHPDPTYLLPDPIETLKAAEILVKEDFTVLPYINADPVLAKRLQDVGTAAVMPLGAPIGSNKGVVTGDQMGGSIKKAQIAHVILSIGKTLEQKEEGRATMAILKSRFGKDGVIFEDILFDNGTLVIDTNDSSDVSFLDFDKGVKKKDSNFIAEVIKKKRETLGGG